MKQAKQILSSFLSLCLLTLIIPYPTSAAANLQGQKNEFQGHSYQVFDGICETWEEAQAYCISLGGHLATISSADENNFLYNLLIDSGYSSAYFGLTDSAKEGEWVWVTGESVTYTNWHPGEPNAENSKEDYAMFYYKFKDGTWNDGKFNNGTFICEWDNSSTGEFRFISDKTVNCIPKNTTFEVFVGYYVDDILNNGTYQISVSDPDIIQVNNTQKSGYGQKISLTAKKPGSAVLKVEHTTQGVTGTLELYVVNSETVCSFDNVPQMTIEAGKTTNCYNYSGMVIDDFQYKEVKNSKGELDHYYVTMTVYNSLDIYGAVTAYDAAGNISDYYVIDKFTTMDSSFIDSIISLVKEVGDFFYLQENNKYYSGESFTKCSKAEVDVPVGGYIEITNNASSPVALFANLIGITVDLATTTGSLTSSTEKIADSKNLIIDPILEKAFTKDYAQAATVKVIKSLAVQELKNSDWSLLNFGDKIQSFMMLLSDSGIDLLHLLSEELASASGIASITESVVLDLIPTGDLINALYALSDAGQLVIEAKQLNESINYPEGIYLYTTSFTDICSTAYYSDSVQWALINEITTGTSTTTFTPDRTCTRAEIITFLWRAAGSPIVQDHGSFSDVPPGVYYEEAVAWAASNELFSGSTFSPNAPCTREMAVEFMWRYAGCPVAEKANFSDVSSRAVDWALEEGITTGTGPSTFSPERTCTRAEIVTLLYRGFAA